MSNRLAYLIGLITCLRLHNVYAPVEFHGSVYCITGRNILDFHNGVGEQEHVLLDDANVLPEGAHGHVPDVVAVDGDAALPDVVESKEQLA